LVETIERIDLPEAIRTRYLQYALSVITARALPDVRDGLKPAQRRILYAMEHELHLRAENRPFKSAKIVGAVMGNYHPHGDTAIYDAMVRMAQDWSLRYPLVDGQGNFGAITGDNAAAMRYTEAKLRPLASELMTTLREGTVPTRPTFDGENEEPVVLPTPAPLLLLNGSTGIAVGMATNIPPHNLREVVKATIALVDKPDTSVAQLLRTVKGPDFPTGGEVLATRETLRKVYETGRGTVKVRGTYELEETKAKGQRVARRRIVIDSIPYGSTTGQILAKVKDLLDRKKLPQITGVSDQTNAEDGVRIVLELKGDDDPAAIMGAVYKLTPLESSYGINLTCLLPTDNEGVGRPAQCDLKQLLQSWLDFRFEVVTKSIEYRKARLEERIHILEGLATVLDAVDAAVKLVRKSKDKADARARLVKRFDLSEAQADAVLEIQLYRLAQLEVKKVEDELKAKKKEVNRLARLLKGEQPRWDLIKQELGEFAERHGDKRRTKMLGGAEDEEHAYDPTLLIKKEDVQVVVTRDGRLKRNKTVEDVDRIRIREGDDILTIVPASTLAHVAYFTNYGSAYVMVVNDVPSTAGFGEPIQKFFSFKDGERIVGAFSLDARALPEGEPQLLVVTAEGNAMRAPLAPHMDVSNKSGRRFARLGTGDEVVAVELLDPSAAELALVTRKGAALRFPLEEVAELAGVGKGKRAIKLGKDDRVTGATATDRLFLETGRGAEETLLARNVPAGAPGEGGEKVKRGGWKGMLPRPIELYELESEE